MRPIVTDRLAWSVGMSVCRSVCRSVTLVSPAKTVAPIEMPFGLRTRVGLGNGTMCSMGVQIPTWEVAILMGGKGVPM